MSHAVQAQHFPRWVLLAAAGLIGLTLVVAARANGFTRPVQASPEAPALEAIELSFEDRPDGAIAVFDAHTGKETSLVPPASNGFIRGVMRGMFRERKLESLGHEGKFRLAREATGRLSLEDLQTHRRIDLDAFGPTNSGAFANLLAAGLQASR